jgi:diamine N-acetyltransferase
MKFIKVNSSLDLSAVVKVLNVAHGTVAKEFGFTKYNNPSNNAFIDEPTLRTQLDKGIELYQLTINKMAVGCIAIERSLKEADTFYIEKVSVLPGHRHKGYGVKLMEFAASKIKASGGKWISIALIDSNSKLKKWYNGQGFIETGTKDFTHLPFRVCFMNKKV